MKKQDKNKQDIDVFGKAIFAYHHHQDETDIIVHSPDFDDDIIPVSVLFRNYEEMPALEKEALNKSYGKVLDVGCGAGSHTLYLQQQKDLDVTGIDISKGAIEICKLRGCKNVKVQDYFKWNAEKYDTLLFMMNGTGIIEKLSNLDRFFEHSKALMTTNGQLLIDSSDLSYLLDPDEDGGIWVDPDQGYYGELEFSISYKGETANKFNWLYLDFPSLELAANKNGFSCELIKKGDHYDYLAKLKVL